MVLFVGRAAYTPSLLTVSTIVHVYYFICQTLLNVELKNAGMHSYGIYYRSTMVWYDDDKMVLIIKWI